MTTALAEPVILALFGFAMFAALLAWLPGGRSDRALTRRIRRIRHAAIEAQAAPRRPTDLVRRERATRLGSMAAALQRAMPRLERMQARFAQAGLTWAPADALVTALLLAGILSLAFTILGLPLPAAIAFAISLVFGGGMLFVSRLVARRAQKFLSLLPEAIELVVRAVKAGLPVSEAIALIGEEVADPVGEVFREVASNMRIGMGLEEALWQATRRVDLAEFRFLVVSVALQRETGGNLAGILSNLATMVRRREQMKLKIRAMSSEARASAAIIGSLPFLVGAIIFAINPDYIAKLFVDPRGQMLALFGLASMLTGIAVIARLVRFDI